MKMSRAVSVPAASARRVIVALSISTFVEWAGAGCALPLLPLYLRKLGAPVSLVGAAMAAFFFAAVFVQYPMGRLSDRLGRRPIQLGGLLTFSVASVAFALIGTPVAALLVRALQGVGAGVVDVANNATVGEIVPANQQGRAYGAVFGARTVGLAIGPFFGGLAGLAGMRWLFVSAAAASLVACVPILLVVPKQWARAPQVRTQRTALWRNRSVLGALCGYAGTGVLIGVYEVCWSLLLHLRGATAWQIGLSWTLFAFPFAAMSIPGGWLVDHFDRRYLAAAATLVSAGFAAVYPFLHSVWLLVALGAIEASAVAVAGPALAAQIAHSVPRRELGRAQGAASTAQTAATGTAALAAGALFALRPWVPFDGGSTMIVVLIALLALCWRGVPGRAGYPSRLPVEAASELEADPALTAAGSGADVPPVGEAQVVTG